MKDDFLSKGRSVSDMKAHLVLTSKYRRKVFNAKMLQRLGEIVENLCQKWDCKLIEFNRPLAKVFRGIMISFAIFDYTYP